MKLKIDQAKCVGHARCQAVAPEVFVLNDEGYISVNQIDVPAGKEQIARRGARACPERIITIEE